MLRHRILPSLVLVSILVLSVSCATDSPVAPPMLPAPRGSLAGPADNGRSLWGMWEVSVDLDGGTITAVPIRSVDLHFNVQPLLKEGSPSSNLTFANLLIDPSSHRLQVDISLRHPFPNLKQVPGFDVRGILFTRGGELELVAADVTMTGADEPRLANADGYTRWWNPQEFPGPSLLGYSDGPYGTPHAVGGYLINLAGYKYFADGLGALDTLDELDTDDRGVFQAGSTNTRRYLIDFGPAPSNWVIFNYAVDASWGKVPGYNPGDPLVVPDDFPLTANCPEPYRIRVTESSNTFSATSASGTSGMVNLNIDVFDWQAMDPMSTVPMEVSVVQVEAPILGLGPIAATVVPGSGADSHLSTYTASISGGCPYKLDYVDIVVTATSSEGDYQNALTYFLGTDPLQAFFLHRAKVLDADTYANWTWRYSRLLYPEWPNQGGNPPDIAVYKKQDIVRAAMVDQVNPDPNHEGDHNPDSINEWSNDYTSYSVPEHYHLPLDMLGNTGKWDDINGICVSDSSTRFFFTNTNPYNEIPDGEADPLYAYVAWVSHTYLGNKPAAAWNTAFFSAGSYPRYFATDPCNGVKVGADYIYLIFIYDVTDLAGPNPQPDPQRYIIFRWAPPYEVSDASADWQRALNVPPNGEGVGYVDRDEPYNHRLAVDDSPALDRFYILDSLREIEVVDCDFTVDEFSGSWPVGTVIPGEWPTGVTDIVDLEVVQTQPLGTPRNHVAALCVMGEAWRVWVFDYDSSQPAGSQAVTQWLSEAYAGAPCSLDASDDPVEAHVLYKSGGLHYVTVFRDFP